MNRLKSFFKILLSGCLGICSTACTDDDLGFRGDGIGEGETIVSLETSFSPFAEGDLTRANIENGNGKLLSNINSLHLFLYDSAGNLVTLDDATEQGKFFPNSIDMTSLTVTDEDRNDADASNGKKAESKTKSITGLNLKLPFGTYYIVAAANLKNETISSLTNDPTNYATLDALRKMKTNWNSDDISQNSEMLGYFTDLEIYGKNTNPPTAEKQFAKVSVNRSGIKLHAWLRRSASKVTIDFDGSNLRENITVYIKEAKIYDIPYDCTLGFGQPEADAAKSPEGTYAYNNTPDDKDAKPNGLIHESAQTISFIRGNSSYATTDHTGWMRISKGMPVIKTTDTPGDEYENAEPIDFHNENADALYFYENMQYNDTEPKKTKLPAYGLNGVVAGEDKDGMTYGTYIEVTGYYESTADGNSTHGEIKYRFMLGKNVTDNFEAERNYHYKLTLCPRGNGNDADWHIVYDEPKGFHVPNPWYVSYLYNHDAMLPFKFVPEDGWELTDLKAVIIKNPWYPSDITEDELTNSNIEIKPAAPTGDEKGPYDNLENQENYNGFLSLRVTDKSVITSTDVPAGTWKDWNNGNVSPYSVPENAKVNSYYYYGSEGASSQMNRGERIYIQNGQKYSYQDYPSDAENLTELKERDDFNYQKDGNSYSFDIPLFTRAKVLIKETGYSGNNLYVDYQRIAQVKLIATVKNIQTGETTDKETIVNCVQVRRVVNPKGVYRRAGNHEPFHVKMKWLKNDKDGEFEDVISHGPWKAEIIGDANFITLDGRQTVSGSTDTPIDFTIRFNRMNNDKNEVHNAVVRIKYHNYTCTHLIFVRQGYAAQEIVPSSDCMDFNTKNGDTGEFKGGAKPAKWSTFNMISKDREATDPRDEGSLFKWGNSDYAIDVSCNIHMDNSGNPMYHNLLASEFNSPGNLIMVDNATGNTQADPKSWSAFEKGEGFTGKMEAAATVRDFEQLYCSNNTHFGYGVLYADGATETQSTIDMAYGYYRRDNSPNAKAKGMRGLFVYYWDKKLTGGSSYNARNIFFPIGRAGYGHRKNGKNNELGGILRYSCSREGPDESTFTLIAPVFASIYRRPGAIYWSGDTQGSNQFLGWDRKPTTGTAYGLDINYFSFDVNSITSSNINSGKDACFVRTIER